MFYDDSIGAPVSAPAKVLKLSEAIRIGARIRPQCRMGYSRQGASCAMGAAWEAVTGQKGGAYTSVMAQHFGVPENLIASVLVKNDEGKSRESIADWLESEYGL